MLTKKVLTSEKWRISPASFINHTIENEKGVGVCKTFSWVSEDVAIAISKTPEMLEWIENIIGVLRNAGFNWDELKEGEKLIGKKIV